MKFVDVRKAYFWEDTHLLQSHIYAFATDLNADYLFLSLQQTCSHRTADCMYQTELKVQFLFYLFCSGTKEELVASATGGAGARGTKMSKKKINRSRLRRFRFVQFGVGKY